MADFFDKVGDMFNKGVATVSSGSKTMIEKTKINTVIKNLQEEQKQLAEALGNTVYNLCKDDREGTIEKAAVAELCDAISLRFEQIEEQKKKMEELDEELRRVTGGPAPTSAACSACGHQNSSGAKFCAKCGNKLV